MIPFTEGTWEYYKYGGILSRIPEQDTRFVVVLVDEFDTGLDMQFKNPADEILVFNAVKMYQMLDAVANWASTRTFQSPEEEKLFLGIVELISQLERAYEEGVGL